MSALQNPNERKLHQRKVQQIARLSTIPDKYRLQPLLQRYLPLAQTLPSRPSLSLPHNLHLSPPRSLLLNLAHHQQQQTLSFFRSCREPRSLWLKGSNWRKSPGHWLPGNRLRCPRETLNWQALAMWKSINTKNSSSSLAKSLTPYTSKPGVCNRKARSRLQTPQGRTLHR